MESAWVDFAPLCHQEISARAEPVCTTSLCGRFFMLAVGHQVYTYYVHGDRWQLVDRRSYEKRVLAMAVDASGDPLAIAILLEGRVGMYIDLTEHCHSPHPASP